LPLFPESGDVGPAPRGMCRWDPPCVPRPRASFGPRVSVADGVTNHVVLCLTCGHACIYSDNVHACAHKVRTRCAQGA
jgi:hypothetical protein